MKSERRCLNLIFDKNQRSLRSALDTTEIWPSSVCSGQLPGAPGRSQAPPEPAAREPGAAVGAVDHAELHPVRAPAVAQEPAIDIVRNYFFAEIISKKNYLTNTTCSQKPLSEEENVIVFAFFEITSKHEKMHFPRNVLASTLLLLRLTT